MMNKPAITIKAKVIVESTLDKYFGFGSDVPKGATNELNLRDIREEIKKGNYELEWINSVLSHEQEPTLIVRLCSRERKDTPTDVDALNKKLEEAAKEDLLNRSPCEMYDED